MSNIDTSSDTSSDAMQGKEFRHGDITVNPADVPVIALFALAQRGFSHVLGNEVAAKVAAWKKTEQGAQAGGDEVASFTSAKRQEALERILAGTLGVRSASSPRVSGFEAICRRVAVEFLTARFASYSKKTGTKVSLPTGDKVVNVAGRDMTREQLIEAEMKRNEAAIRAEASRRQASQSADAEGDELSDLLA